MRWSSRRRWLTPAQRAELIREANAAKAETAEDLGLGAKEKLVVT
ncbi:hypothetical protein SANTM175S_02438 [Streptomyces antimycoticus]